MIHVPWPAVVQHAQTQIEEARGALERAEIDRIPAIQARIAVWREVLDLPERLKNTRISDEISTYS